MLAARRTDSVIGRIKFLTSPFTSLINRRPATMLAARRTDSVIGRIKFLTSSITTIKGIRTSGVPDGTKCAKNLFIVVIELVRNFIRPITLSVRLAANIVAGHLLIRLVNGGRLSLVTAPIIVLSGMVLIVLEVSVAFIQGYVFSTLRVIYFSELNSALAANKS